MPVFPRAKGLIDITLRFLLAPYLKPHSADAVSRVLLTRNCCNVFICTTRCRVPRAQFECTSRARGRGPERPELRSMARMFPRKRTARPRGVSQTGATSGMPATEAEDLRLYMRRNGLWTRRCFFLSLSLPLSTSFFVLQQTRKSTAATL